MTYIQLQNRLYAGDEVGFVPGLIAILQFGVVASNDLVFIEQGFPFSKNILSFECVGIQHIKVGFSSRTRFFLQFPNWICV